MSEVAEKPRHSLAVMDRTGDTKTMWNPDNKDEVDVARATFDALRKKSYAIFRVKGDGEKGEMMTQFDPKAAKLIAVPPVVAG